MNYRHILNQLSAAETIGVRLNARGVKLLRWLRRRYWAMMLITLAVLATEARAQKGGGSTTFYSPGGSVTGRAVTAPSGGTTFYNDRGSVTGRATTSPSGTTTFYSPGGSVTGRANSWDAIEWKGSK